jgi:hypothetical protein
MATKVNIKDIQGKVDFSQSAEPTLNTEQTNTGFGFFDYIVKAINWIKTKLGDKANDTQAIDYTATSTQLTNEQSHLINVILNTYGGNIAQLFSNLEDLGIKQKKIYPITGDNGTILASNHNISTPAIILFYKEGVPIVLEYKILANGDIQWSSSVSFLPNNNVIILIIG